MDKASFLKLVCKAAGHDWNEVFVCKRCNYLRKYEEFTEADIDNGGIPHDIVMDYMRRKYLNYLPPAQRYFNDGE